MWNWKRCSGKVWSTKVIKQTLNVKILSVIKWFIQEYMFVHPGRKLYTLRPEAEGYTVFCHGVQTVFLDEPLDNDFIMYLSCTMLFVIINEYRV